MGVLAALTPSNWEVTFYDDRMEPVDYEASADLVAISIEAYSARRGYQIAAKYRQRGIPVIFGGYHATFCPEEALEHGDAVCVGEAEMVWEQILEDARAGRLKKRYQSAEPCDLGRTRVNREIFRGKNYMRLTLVETGRGCPFRCDFCSISAFYNAKYRRRPIPNIVSELKQTHNRFVLFVDDNLTADIESARELFAAVKPLGIRWITQISLVGLQDKQFVRDMAESGCIAVLIGFESMNPDNLALMRKAVNRVSEYRTVLQNLREAGIFVYGTFIFGYPSDTPDIYDRSVKFAEEEKMFIAAFNHLVPFPGTPLYKELEAQGRMRYPKWWLSEDFYFGQVPFNPSGMTAADIEFSCLRARRKFYSGRSIVKRALEFRANCANPQRTFYYFFLNYLLRREVSEKRGIPLGIAEESRLAVATR